MKKIIITIFFPIVPSSGMMVQKAPDYQNPTLPIPGRVKDLISRMTLEEKVWQLESQLTFPEKYKDRIRETGHYRNPAHFLHGGPKGHASTIECAEAINEDTRKSIAASRWGIPVLQHGEALHGAQWGITTISPQSIGQKN